MNPFLKHLADEFGTPLYTYDLGAARSRAEELISLLPDPDSSRILYSFKANPLPSLAREFHRAGCEADLTSVGELAASQAAGFDSSRALYGGPGKSSHELREAIDSGVRQFSIESWADLSTLAESARSRGIRVTGLLRINPTDPPKARVAMAGVASQFGFEQADLQNGEAKGKIAASSDVIDFAGFHIYWGTQVSDVEALAESFASAVNTAEQLSADLNIPLRILNLGGGFPWPYAHRGAGPNLAPLRTRIRNIHAAARAARDAQWWFESGRYLASSSGSLVCRVMDIKDSKDRRFVILDSGINHLGGMAGLGRIPRFSIDIEPEVVRASEEKVDVVGQLCTPLDCLGRNLQTPSLQPGDLVEIPNVGAYGLTASVVGFLSRPVPLEITHRHGKVDSVHRLRSGHECLDPSEFNGSRKFAAAPLTNTLATPG